MLQASKHVSRYYQYLKIKFLSKHKIDRTTCPAIQGFVPTILNFDQTLSVDRPLFQAQHNASNFRRVHLRNSLLASD